MRPEEYLSLKWSDVDPKAETATVRRTLVWRKGGGWYFGEPKTSRSRRTIPLPTSLVAALGDHRRKQGESRLKKGADYQNNDLVFATSEGTPILLRNLVRRHFRPVITRAKLSETFRLYDLRHSCATLLLSAVRIQRSFLSAWGTLASFLLLTATRTSCRRCSKPLQRN